MVNKESLEKVYRSRTGAEIGALHAKGNFDEITHRLREEFAGHKSYRTKEGGLDLTKIPVVILQSALNVTQKLVKEDKFEAKFDLYEEVKVAIRNGDLDKDMIQSYCNYYELVKDTKKEILGSKKITQEVKQNGEMDEPYFPAVEEVVAIVKNQKKEQITNKFKKDNDIKISSPKEKNGADASKVQEVIDKLELNITLR